MLLGCEENNGTVVFFLNLSNVEFPEDPLRQTDRHVDKQQNKTALLENLQECEQGYK
jgi:hypothetical protein